MFAALDTETPNASGVPCPRGQDVVIYEAAVYAESLTTWRLIAFYRAEKGVTTGAGMTEQQPGRSGVCDMTEVQHVLRRRSMKTSARNQFAGPASALQEGVVVTEHSVKHLGLPAGQSATAVVKASSVFSGCR